MTRIHNLETDEIIDREMTNEELEKHTAYQLSVSQAQAQAEARAEAKAAAEAKLVALGLDLDDLRALGL
jgi:hypothetical protein